MFTRPEPSSACVQGWPLEEKQGTLLGHIVDVELESGESHGAKWLDASNKTVTRRDVWLRTTSMPLTILPDIPLFPYISPTAPRSHALPPPRDRRLRLSERRNLITETTDLSEEEEDVDDVVRLIHWKFRNGNSRIYVASSIK